MIFSIVKYSENCENIATFLHLSPALPRTGQSKYFFSNSTPYYAEIF